MFILNAFNKLVVANGSNTNIILKRAIAGRRSASTVGFIGLGNMGGPMAKNLMKKGHSLVVYDTLPEAVEAAVKNGAAVGKSPADVASRVSCLVTMLPNNDIVTNVYTGDNGVFQGVKQGSLLLDCSTVDPSVPISLSAQAGKKGLLFLDAPVSGGVPAAVSGELTFMVGGDTAVFEKAKEVLSGMGKRLFHCGGPGMGQAAKMWPQI